MANHANEAFQGISLDHGTAQELLEQVVEVGRKHYIGLALVERTQVY
jgi:hypothetical protein